MEIKELFEKYIFGWMCRDIEREIDWARKGDDGGNALCALGLLAYTEFMGRFLFNISYVRHPLKTDKDKFNAFLSYMDSEYEDLVFIKKKDIYNIFRCGLAHEYFVKRDCTIAMLNSTPGRLKIHVPSSLLNQQQAKRKFCYLKKPAKCGLGIAKNGGYWFIVEKYYEDFRNACERLYKEPQVPRPIIDFYEIHPTTMSSSG
jgi:hypothetical protein